MYIILYYIILYNIILYYNNVHISWTGLRNDAYSPFALPIPPTPQALANCYKEDKISDYALSSNFCSLQFS